jgi:hypothetical protein
LAYSNSSPTYDLKVLVIIIKLLLSILYYISLLIKLVLPPCLTLLEAIWSSVLKEMDAISCSFGRSSSKLLSALRIYSSICIFFAHILRKRDWVATQEIVLILIQPICVLHLILMRLLLLLLMNWDIIRRSVTTVA